MMVLPTPDGFFMPQDPWLMPRLLNHSNYIVGHNTMDTLWGPPFGLALFGNMLGDPIPRNRSAYAQLVSAYFGDRALALFPPPPEPSATSGPVASASAIEAEVPMSGTAEALPPLPPRPTAPPAAASTTAEAPAGDNGEDNEFA